MSRHSREEQRWLAEQRKLNQGYGDVLSSKPRLAEDKVFERVAIRLNASEHRHLRKDMRENGTRYRGFTKAAAFNHPKPAFKGPKWPEYRQQVPSTLVSVLNGNGGEKKK